MVQAALQGLCIWDLGNLDTEDSVISNSSLRLPPLKVGKPRTRQTLCVHSSAALVQKAM